MINFGKNKTLKNIIFIILLVLFFYYEYQNNVNNSLSKNDDSFVIVNDLNNIPDYEGKDVIVINNNEPNFDDLAKTTNSFEVYGELDNLGRCSEAYANIGRDLMPTKERDRISQVKPSGWKYTKYDFIDGKYLYNRCHLIAYSLTAENANEKNLITCTRYTNATLMQKYEIMVANYIRKTSNHVLYRVKPIFKGDNLIASAIQMEALSIEDNGKGIKFNVLIYNVEPNVRIDYSNGNSELINSK